MIVQTDSIVSEEIRDYVFGPKMWRLPELVFDYAGKPLSCGSPIFTVTKPACVRTVHLLDDKSFLARGLGCMNTPGTSVI